MHKLSSIHLSSLRIHANGSDNILQIAKETLQPQPKLIINPFDFISITKRPKLFQAKPNRSQGYQTGKHTN
jgi:hypothetical protein